MATRPRRFSAPITSGSLGGATYTLVMYDSVLYEPGHTVDRFAGSIQRAMRNGIRAAAPVNKRENTGHGPRGGLKAGIRGSKQCFPGRKSFEVVTISTAPYTAFVINGTPAQVSQRGKFKIPNNPGFGFGDQKAIRGQAANDFMSNGMKAVSARHPSVRYRRRGLSFDQ